MQTAVPGGKRVLSALPGALFVEPGKLRKPRLPAADVYAARAYDPFLAFFLYGNIFAVAVRLDVPKVRTGHSGWLVDAKHPEDRRGDVFERSTSKLFSHKSFANQVEWNAFDR